MPSPTLFCGQKPTPLCRRRPECREKKWDPVRPQTAAGLERRGLHALRHTFATNLVNGVKQPDGAIRALSPRQVADLLCHSTSEITELYYVKKDTSRLAGITAGFDL